MTDPVQLAKSVISGYQDPQTPKMQGFDWKPLTKVHQELGEMSEIPSHVEKFGEFMHETARKAATTGLSPRDLVKAYLITRASIQRQAISSQKLEQAGLILPPNVPKTVRPEGAMGEWLHTPHGQRFLDAAERGQVDDEAVANAQQVMKPFGKMTETDALPWAVHNLVDKSKEVSDMVKRSLKGLSSPDEWRSFTSNVRGVGPAKSGFLASMLGRGDQPTLDARQVILQTGLSTKDAQNPLRRAGADAVDRLASRQSALNLRQPAEMEPFRQHLTHHAIWDKVGNEQTTHSDVVDAMRHAATGGRIGFKDGGPAHGDEPPSIAEHPLAKAILSAAHSGSWDDVPTINPDHLIGKKVFPIMADLTATGAPYTGIDSTQLHNPVPLRGGPGYPLIPANQKHGVVWAVQGKGRGTMKLGKDADYGVVTSMNPDTHRSNATFTQALTRTAIEHAKAGRITPENVSKLDEMIRTPTQDPTHARLAKFPGLQHPHAGSFTDSLNFESRKRIADVLGSPTAQKLGAPDTEKLIRATADPAFAGLNRSQALYLIKLAKGDDSLVHLKDEGLPEHESYAYGIKGHVVGKFHHPVAPETLWHDWHKEQEAAGKQNIRRAFDLALPTGTITPEIAAMLPRHPKDMQSPLAARMALHTALDHWHSTDDPVKEGGLSPTELSEALRRSDSSSTLSQYSPDDLKGMIKKGNFKGYRLHGGKVYFGLKKNTDYGDEYGFHHPDLTKHETALVSVVNNEPGAKGIGGPAVVLKAIKEGATALDAYAVPSAKHPNGFLPDYYSHFGFKELGRIPFDPKYVSKQQFEDMKHHWRSQGWDESRGLPDLAIMKWKGEEGDRQEALRRHLGTGSTRSGGENHPADVQAAADRAERGAVPHRGAPQGLPHGDQGGDRGGVRNGDAPRPTDRLSRTISAATALSPQEATTFGVEPDLVAKAKAAGFKAGGAVDLAKAITRFKGGRVV
jgi:hypothetical protein